MDSKELDEIQRVAVFSGWPRDKSSKLILKLVKELRKRPLVLPLLKTEDEPILCKCK